MQLCDVTLLHAGNLLTQIRKVNVTVPEIAVLQHVHGPDAVTGIVVTRTIKRPAAVEIERLLHLYDPQGTDEEDHPVNKLWPGQQQQKMLPKTLADLGITKDSPLVGYSQRSVPNEDAVNYHRMDDLETEGDPEELAALDGGDGMDDDPDELAAEELVAAAARKRGKGVEAAA